MRLFFTFVLCLVLLPVAYPQTAPVYHVVGESDLGGWKQDGITASKFLSAENVVVLVTRKTIRRWDVATAKFLEPIPIGTEESSESIISPDGHKLLVFGNYKAKHPASIWDLRTGKQIAVLTRPSSKPIRGGHWSRNGKTLVTSSSASRDTADANVEISFWDGETFKYLNSLPEKTIHWWHLTNDGTKCFYTVRQYWQMGMGMKILMLGKRFVIGGGPMNVWDTNSGAVEQIITANDASSERQIGGIAFTPDETRLAFIARRPAQFSYQTRIIAMDIDKSYDKGNSPKYSFKLKFEAEFADDISDDDLTFSPDGDYLATNSERYLLRIYDGKTGDLKFDLDGVESGRGHWLIDDKILLYDFQHGKTFTFQASTGKRDYLDDVDYGFSHAKTEGDNRPLRAITEYVPKILAIPDHDMVLAYNAHYVKVFDSDTGELLQAIVDPPKDFRGGLLVLQADWSDDGKTIYVISGDGSKVTIWSRIGK